MSETNASPLLVIGAGIAGVTAALEAAEMGSEVVLVEREPAIGGRVLRLTNYFPKLCPPSCGMEINTRRLERNPRIRVVTSAQVTGAQKTDSGWSVTVTRDPAYVTDVCTACGDCEKACDTMVPDPHNLEMSKVKAIRLPHLNAWPVRFHFDRAAVGDEEAGKIAEACTVGAVNPDAAATTETIEVGAVVVATGWHPYPIENLEEFGGGKISDVIANVHMERMASPSGPTGGKIVCPSTNEPPKTVAFVQCAGSRDVNHLNYCSSVCCLASLKQATYVKSQLPDAEVTMYYIDRRTPGRNEDFLVKVAEMEGVKLVKGKVGRIEQNGSIKLHVEDVENVKLIEVEPDLVVLATGMVPNAADNDLALFTRKDDEGFVLDDLDSGVTVAGVARRPEDVAASVRDATGAAARAVIAAGGRA
jgi:quinone-modifying oxidoreductase subunit QmoA